MPEAQPQFAAARGAKLIRALTITAAMALMPGLPASWNLAQAKAPPARAEEYRLKAAFIYNILSFVDWPAGAVRERLVVGFAGEGPMEAALRGFLKNEKVGTTAIEFRLAHGGSELRACNVLYLAYPDEGRMREALSQLQGESVLTIGDGEEFVRMGGMVGFVAQDNKLRLLVNPGTAQRAHLRISSKLLKIAAPVYDEPGGKD
jgi:YfiR/HmsC-like